MERIVHISHSFKEADEWTRRQYREMTPGERFAVARELVRRAYGPDSPDVRESHRLGECEPPAK